MSRRISVKRAQYKKRFNRAEPGYSGEKIKFKFMAICDHDQPACCLSAHYNNTLVTAQLLKGELLLATTTTTLAT